MRRATSSGHPRGVEPIRSHGSAAARRAPPRHALEPTRFSRYGLAYVLTGAKGCAPWCRARSSPGTAWKVCAASFASGRARLKHTMAQYSVSPWVPCHTMLRAGHAPVAYRAPPLAGFSVQRYGGSATAAPALAGQPLLAPLGLCNGLLRFSLSASTLPPALRARRRPQLDAPLRVYCRDKSTTEVRSAPSLASCALSYMSLLCRVTGFEDRDTRHGVGEAHRRCWHAVPRSRKR